MGCVCPQGEEELHWQSFPSRVLAVSSFVTIFLVSTWTQKRVETFLIPQVAEMSPVQPIYMGVALSTLPVSSGKLGGGHGGRPGVPATHAEAGEQSEHMLRARYCQAFCMKCQKVNNLDFVYDLCCNDSVLLS